MIKRFATCALTLVGFLALLPIPSMAQETNTMTAMAGEAQTSVQELRAISLDDGGEIIIEGKDYRLVPWTGPQSLTTPQVVNYIPGTLKGRDRFQSLTDRMKSDLPPAYTFTAIVDLDASGWATRSFARSNTVSEKRENPLATIAFDNKGHGRKAWALPEGFGFFVLNASGQVVAAQTTEPSQADLDQLFDALDQLLDTP